MSNDLDGVNEETLRDFVHKGNKWALSEQQLKAIASDYLNKVIRTPKIPPRWPRDTRDMMGPFGIIQDRETGLPVKDHAQAVRWENRALVSEQELVEWRDLYRCVINFIHQKNLSAEFFDWKDEFLKAEEAKRIEKDG